MLPKHPHCPLLQHLRLTVTEILAELRQRDHVAVIAAVAESANAIMMTTGTTVPHRLRSNSSQ